MSARIRPCGVSKALARVSPGKSASISDVRIDCRKSAASAPPIRITRLSGSCAACPVLLLMPFTAFR